MLSWNFSAIISYANNTWDSVEARLESGVTYYRGPDVSQHPEVVNLLTQLQLSPRQAVVDETITSIVFRFSATYYGQKIYIASGVDEANITTDNLSLISEQLGNDEFFNEVFMSGNFSYSTNVRPYLVTNNRQSIVETQEVGNVIKFGRTLSTIDGNYDVYAQSLTYKDGTLYRVCTRYVNPFVYVEIQTYVNNELIENRVVFMDGGGDISSCAVDDDGVIWVVMNSSLKKITTDDTIVDIPNGYYNDTSLLYITEGTFAGLVGFDRISGILRSIDTSSGDMTDILTFQVPEGMIVNQIRDVSYNDGAYYIYATLQGENTGEGSQYFNMLMTVNEDLEYQVIREFDYEFHKLCVVDISLMYFTPDSNSPYALRNIYEFNEDVVTLISERESYDTERMGAAFNNDDNCIYVFRFDDQQNFEFYKIDRLLSPSTVQIELDEKITPIKTKSYISDGGSDMYDRGNFIKTDRINIVEWTHTQQELADQSNFSEIADGSVEPGTVEFGPGSQYFTNMYTGMFVMGVKNMSINSFTIFGELGADGSGTAEKGQFDITRHSRQYTVYYKRVYGAYDPSVNHLIIVPKNNNIQQAISESTNVDYHELSGLSGVNTLFYLLYATKDPDEGETSNYESEENYRNVVNNFFSVVNPNDALNTSLNNLNTNITDITGDITDIFNFTDYPNGYRVSSMFANNDEDNISLCYIGNDTFIGLADRQAFTISTTGEIQLRQWEAIENSELGEDTPQISDINALLYYQNELYAVANGRILLKLNPVTGAVLDIMKFAVNLDSFEITVQEYDVDVTSLVIGQDLNVYAYCRHSDRCFYSSVNLQTGAVIGLVEYENTNDDHQIVMGVATNYKSIGFGKREYAYPTGFLGRDGAIFVYVQRNTIPIIDPTPADLRFQFTRELNDIIDNSGWENVDCVSISDNGSNYVCTLDEITEGDDVVLVRFRLASESTNYWAYAIYD